MKSIRDSKSAKSAILTQLEALNFDFHAFSRLKFTKLTKFRAEKLPKTAVLEPLDSPKLISWKF